MNIDLLGSWQGAFQTDGLWFYPALFDQQGAYQGNTGSGGPPQDLQVILRIKWQGDYQNFSNALVVSPFYGELLGVQRESIPLSGFVNEYGFIKISFYSDARPEPPGVQQTIVDWNFNSFIVTRGGDHIMAGTWVKTSWSQGLLAYQKGTLRLQRALTLKERIYLVLNKLWLRIK